MKIATKLLQSRSQLLDKNENLINFINPFSVYAHHFSLCVLFPVIKQFNKERF